MNNSALYIGIDVGSTTVKAVVMDGDNLIWKDYKRHNTKQPELVFEFLKKITDKYSNRKFVIYTTGNGGKTIAPYLNSVQIQEVNAVTYAVEKLHPNAGSAIELGGQDAKIIIWRKDKEGRKTTLSFMNDKCAGGTGATLDKIFAKLSLSAPQIAKIRAKDKTIHQIAAKCGVFAETDVIGLLKAGVDEEEIVISLCAAIVKQNIEVLLHGNILNDDVLLLGGPHSFVAAFVDIWRDVIPETWKLHKWQPKNKPIESLVYVPSDSQYFAAIGAVFYGRESQTGFDDSTELNLFLGFDKLEAYLNKGKLLHLESLGEISKALVQSEQEVEEFAKEYSIPPFSPPVLKPKSIIDSYLGIDGGSTSSKIAIIDTKGELIYKDYVLSKGNPIVDVRQMFGEILKWQQKNEITLNFLGSAVTGYASDILKQAFALDLSIVETIAHLKSAKHYYGDQDIICDVGGQDIKVLFMKHGRVVDIKLNTQCSAGNGYFLQAMAHQFGVPIEQYATHAFSVRKAPLFNYGCAVFLEQDKVNFQQLGWSKEEIMAGLALVLPLNIWNYVVQETNLARLGTRFLLQGGTQKNLAAVKAQVDFIKSKIQNATVSCHKYADIAGAIGAAIEVKERRLKEKIQSCFVGLQVASQISFVSRNDDKTQCTFCSNKCSRTFIDIPLSKEKNTRYISGYGCEKGMSDNLKDMKENERKKKELLDKCPNMVHEASGLVFKQHNYKKLPSNIKNADASEKRNKMVVGIPKLLNMYVYAPFFEAYFKCLGVGSIVYSPYTSEKLWNNGNKWGAIDPCFPAKVAPAHIYDLLKTKEVTHICFPMITHLESMINNAMGNNACVIQMGTPEVVHAAFTKGNIDHFADAGITYLKPLVRMDKKIEATANLYDYFKDILKLTKKENEFAVKQGYKAMNAYFSTLQNKGAKIINKLVQEDKIGILFIGHPYHHDPGFNHGILEQFQLKGFPILCIESLPMTKQFLEPLFGEDILNEIKDPFDINDVWQRNFNRNTNAKIWAAKIAARHPNLAVIDLSSFKCGHDAPTYSYIDNILDASKTPHFLFHDIDQNKPSSTIKIRIQSIEYFLKQEERLLSKNNKNILDN